MRHGCSTSLQNESSPAWNAITRISFTKKFMTQPSIGKIMASVLWDSEGMIHVDFLTHGVTMHSITVISFAMMCPN
jgi:hypothetical protein